MNAIDTGFKLKLFLEKFGIRSAVLNSELPQNSRQHILQVHHADHATLCIDIRIPRVAVPHDARKVRLDGIGRRQTIRFAEGSHQVLHFEIAEIERLREHAPFFVAHESTAGDILVFAFGVGPLTQLFLRHLVVRLEPARDVDGVPPQSSAR